MDDTALSQVKAELAITLASLQRAEERNAAGHLALELMHEIRGPLEALGHLLFLAREQSEDSAQVREYLRLGNEQIYTINHIASQTLGFARSARVPKATALAGVAEAALRIHQRAIATKKVKVVQDLQPEAIAEVHPGEILQVLSNVIVNALDALPEEGTLSLRLRKCHGQIHFVIADNGRGIAGEHLADIFQPFFSTKEERGTGLGLALSHDIVARHRGKIRIRSSVDPGKSGTTFRISLPLPPPLSDAAVPAISAA